MEIGHVHAARMMDPENVGKEAILKVTDWLRGIWEMRRRAGPIQQWVDSIPSPTKPAVDDHPVSEENPTPPLTPVSTKESIFANPSMTISSPISVPGSPAITMTGTASPSHHSRLARDPSFQSDSSHCSSVESLLELRRADPEAILLGLGFGGCTNSSQENGPLSRIPKRFLQPSKLKGIAINDFVKHQQETSESLDSASLGYRGLTGSPYVAPSEIVQKIMERLRDHESHEQDAYTVHNNNTEPYSPIFQDTSRLSVLSPDNRQFLERPRSKSPDMRNKRMIIGQKSFAFGCDGDLIEINPLSQEQEARHTRANGNANDREIELDESSEVTVPLLEISLESSYVEEAKEPMSTISNGRSDKRLAEQLSTDDSGGECLISPDADSLADDEFYPGPRVNSVGSSSLEMLRPIDEDATSDRWKTRRAESVDEATSSESPRRASDGLCDTRIPWPRLTRDEGRRFSDGFIRQPSSLLNRRRSLKRQARISDAEAARYCDSDSCSELVLPEEIEQTECSPDGESPDLPEATRIEEDETEERNHRSDRVDAKENEYPGETPTEINGKAKADGGGARTKKVKNRPGLGTLLDMHKSVMSIRMEPGF